MESTGKRLAKNTACMYIRMIILLLISLYTSRIVLQQLGVEDYGIYNLVGSVVLMLGSLRTMFSSSTQRFLNFEMGKGNVERLRLIYNHSILINIFISIIFVLLAEIIGLLFLEYKANIGEDRVIAAHIVFQLSIAGSVVNLLSTTFDALIIAHERMRFYAYFTVLQGVLYLAVAFLLAFVDGDKLIYYGFLMLCVPIVTFWVIKYYCKKNFEESHFDCTWDKNYLKQMLGFASWNFLGNTAFALTHNGLNMVLNVFGGPVVNAARGIAYQVNSVTNQFMSNVNIVIVPYSIKIYAEGERRKAFDFMFFSSKILFSIQLLLVVILSYFTPYILQLWLGFIPEYAVAFIRIILLYSLLRSLHTPIDTLFKAEGNLRLYQILEISVLLMPLITSVFVMKIGMPYYWVFILIVLYEMVNLIVNLLLLRKIVHFHIRPYAKDVLFHCLVCAFICALMFYICVGKTLVILIIASILSMLLSVLYMYFMGFSRQERLYIDDVIKKTLKRKN